MKYVHLQLIALDDDDDEQVFLLAASEAGVAVEIECIALQVAGDEEDPFTWVDVFAEGDTECTVEKASGGIHKMVIDLSDEDKYKDLDDDLLIEVQVKHAHAAEVHSHLADRLSRGEFNHSHVSFEHFGIAVFAVDHEGNVNMGQ